MEIVVGIDAHTRTHTAAAVDAQGRQVACLQVGASPREITRLLRWIVGLGQVVLVAVEGARGLGLPLTRRLVESGHTVVDVAPALTAEARRQGRRRGKDDEIDAVAIARVALREPRLPCMTAKHLDADLKLLVDTRDQLVQEEARVRNRLHALLLAMAPGYRTSTGALISRAALDRARHLALKARRSDPVRARLAMRAIERLRAIGAETRELEEEIAAIVRAGGNEHLLAICGVGPLVAAKILGEVRDVHHYSSAAAFAAHAGTAPVPASSGNTHRHRLARGGNRQLNRALFTIAMVQARWDPDARTYLARKRAEGKTSREARRCLKRHLANVVYRAMQKDAAARDWALSQVA